MATFFENLADFDSFIWSLWAAPWFLNRYCYGSNSKLFENKFCWSSASGRTERTCPNQLNKLVWLLVESPSSTRRKGFHLVESPSSTKRKSLGQDSRALTQQSWWFTRNKLEFSDSDQEMSGNQHHSNPSKEHTCQRLPIAIQNQLKPDPHPPNV